MTLPLDSSAAPSDLGAVDLLLGQLAEELAFATTGSDAGLLAINAVLMDLEQATAAELPPPLAAGLPRARTLLDRTLDGTGKFNADTLLQLAQWHDWMSAASTAITTRTLLPPLPTDWQRQPEPAAPATPPGGPDGSGKVSAMPAPSQAAADEPSISLNLPADQELLREFHSESVELLQNIEQGVLVLEENPGESATINAVFRAFHTFKGGAGFLHLEAMRDLAHELESLLDAVRQGKLTVTQALIGLVLAGGDALGRFTRAIGAQLAGDNTGSPITVPTKALIGQLRAALRGELPPQEPVRPQATEPASTTAASAAPAQQPPSQPEREASAAEAGSAFVKLETSKLDSLINLVGELVIAQSMVVQNPSVQKVLNLDMVRNLRQLSRITKELQHNVTSLRMVPIRGLFRKMGRLVRDLGIEQQKQVQLLLEGEETELDRNIVEKMSDPLIHMIRNSIDHAVESPAERVALGKPAVATIHLEAAHERGGIVIRVRDDGRGLNGEKIRRRAVERGLVAANADLSDPEIYQLIFLPGFSTAESITELSGRGVGMDIVRGNIESLRGKIEISSSLGAGTTFSVILPLTLAIIDGLLVSVGTQRFIIPTLAVRESFRPQAHAIATVHGRGEMVTVRGRQMPILRLAQHFGIPSGVSAIEEGILIVIESGDASRAILVDALIGKQEVVIKNLGRAFSHQNLMAGGAVLGDGSVGLILDVDTLVRMPPAASTLSNTATAGNHP